MRYGVEFLLTLWFVGGYGAALQPSAPPYARAVSRASIRPKPFDNLMNLRHVGA